MGPRAAKPSAKRKPPAPKKAPSASLPRPDEAALDSAFSKHRITVRMYRDILGDCFLVRFPNEGRTVHMLIDCGILQGMPGATERARRIMSNVASVTRRLDVLVATHEHVDHLSGFAQARDIFDSIEVEELWLAWTENPRDEQANNLRRGRSRAVALLEQSYTALARVPSASSALDEDYEDDADADGATDRQTELDGLRGLMAFSGRDPGQPALAATATTSGILAALKAKAKQVRFLDPGGATLSLPGAPHVTTYVLGPPRDEAFLRRSDPSKAKPEVYSLSSDTIDENGFLVAALGVNGSISDLSADQLSALKLSLPFGLGSLIVTREGAETMSARQAPDALAAFEAAYGSPEDKWRRIDTDWLGAAEQLALKLDSDTNNTSLALAFEIGSGPTSRVLLFPADAQVGNWLSWGDYVWPPEKKRGEPGAVTIVDLLAKTVLYKVGHHCSHNATLREGGLELMTHPDLVAMIPVQQEFANKTKHWNMPFPSLLARLRERTSGRVIRADVSKADMTPQAARHLPSDAWLGEPDWASFLNDVREIFDAEGALALEYRL